MERRLTEEQLTKAVLQWLEANAWEIICYDFPQSGTGISLHPNEGIRTSKNKGAIIPDIVAVKNSIVVFFENKDRFVLSDFIKLKELKQGTDYSEALNRLLAHVNPSAIYYGAGLPLTDNVIQKVNDYSNDIDFAILVDEVKNISVQYQITSIF